MATTAAATAACVSLSPATVLLGAAESNNNSKEIEVCPAVVAANDAIDTAITVVVVSKSKNVVNDALLSSAADQRRVEPPRKARRTPPQPSPIPDICNDQRLQETSRPCNHPRQEMGCRERKDDQQKHCQKALVQSPMASEVPTWGEDYPGNSELKDMTPLEAFLMMMPLNELSLILKLTNKNLESSGKKELPLQELLRWFDVTLLMSASNFRGDCHTLWEGDGSVSKYIPPVNLKATGMSSNC